MPITLSSAETGKPVLTLAGPRPALVRAAAARAAAVLAAEGTRTRLSADLHLHTCRVVRLDTREPVCRAFAEGAGACLREGQKLRTAVEAAGLRLGLDLPPLLVEPPTPCSYADRSAYLDKVAEEREAADRRRAEAGHGQTDDPLSWRRACGAAA